MILTGEREIQDLTPVIKDTLNYLENGPKEFSHISWLLGALYNEWKQIKGYNKLDPKENEVSCNHHSKNFLIIKKDQGI